MAVRPVPGICPVFAAFFRMLSALIIVSMVPSCTLLLD